MRYELDIQPEPFETDSEFEEGSEILATELADLEWKEGSAQRRRPRSPVPRARPGIRVASSKRLIKSPFRPPIDPFRPVIFPTIPWPPVIVAEPKPPAPAGTEPKDAAPAPAGEPTTPSAEPSAEGSEHVRWVQDSLNRILGLQLPVDGIMDAATRSAVRSFQQREGLPADGVVGPDTERALIAARSRKSPQVGAAKPANPGMVTPPASATTPLTAEFDFEFERPEARMEDAGERKRKALAKRLQNTPVGRALAKMGAKITIEKAAPPFHPAHWVRGLSGFEVHCGQQRNINVVLGLFDQQKKWLAWYLFSSTVDSRSKLACKRSGSTPAMKPFGVASAVATITPDLHKSQIDVSELVRDAKSPSATMTLDTKTDNNRITCRLDKLNTKSNGLVHLTFGLQKVSQPSRANVAIPGKLFFLDAEPFDDEKFREPPVLDPRSMFGPQAVAEKKAISNF